MAARRRGPGLRLAGLLAVLTGAVWLTGCAAGDRTPPA